jgi:hypothetical protein
MKSVVYAKVRIQQIVEQMTERPKDDAVFFGFDPDVEEVVQIEVVDEEPKPSNFLGYLYRVDFDKDGNFNILYLS